jgi:multiple sugar transport system ATP-binding protein
MSGASPEVALVGVTRRFPTEGRGAPRAVLRDLSIDVQPRELVVVVGPSGCGKSTTLRLVAGLDEPDEGEVRLAGRPMRGVAPQERDVAMVFQGYALYPHMTAREILEFPLKMRGAPRAARDKAVAEAAELLSIERLLDRRPDQLSGGERQRVAMGRAIVRRPRVFLFDEPLSNLDAALRGDIRLEIGALVRRLGASALYVTHDHVEAMTLADRIAVLRDGHLEQMATPRALYEEPATRFVATFVGTPAMNILAGRVEGAELRFGPFSLPAPAAAPGEVDVGVRPEHVRVAQAGEPGAEGTLVAVEPLGAETHVVVEAGGATIRARLPGFQALERGGQVRVGLDGALVHLFSRGEGGGRLASFRAPGPPAS